MKKWVLCNKTGCQEEIEKKFSLSPVAARVLINRGVDSIEKAQEYLYPSLDQLHNPRLLKDADKAAENLNRALRAGKSIRVIGDYDVDGVSSTFILSDALKRLAAVVASSKQAVISYRIPDRVRDGYGMNNVMVDECRNDGVELIITCDNGIAAAEQVAYAAGFGIDTIVTDHHEIPETIPAALAVVDPKQQDCEYPFKSICGAVVAAKVIELLVEDYCTSEERVRAFEYSSVVEQYNESLAMATVCDVMPLIDENRAIVKLGIDKIRKNVNLGLEALISESKLDADAISTYHLGYILGPCFNATGRLAVADKALALLNAKTTDEAKQYAKECKTLNDERKDLTAIWLDKAVEVCEASALASGLDKVLVVFLDGCHESLAGIIAGRLRERYSRPTIVLTRTESGIKGSGRSIEAYNMFEEISKASHLLTKFGGHPMAAGLSLEEKNIEAFRALLNSETTLTDADMVEKLLLDAVVPFGMISEQVIEELSLLEPFGVQNSKPVFAERDLDVLSARVIGKSSKFFKFRLSNNYGRSFDAVYFGDFDELENRLILKYGSREVDAMFAGRKNSVKLTVAYYPQINEYMGNRSIQMVISEIERS